MGGRSGISRSYRAPRATFDFERIDSFIVGIHTDIEHRSSSTLAVAASGTQCIASSTSLLL